MHCIKKRFVGLILAFADIVPIPNGGRDDERSTGDAVTSSLNRILPHQMASFGVRVGYSWSRYGTAEDERRSA